MRQYTSIILFIVASLLLGCHGDEDKRQAEIQQTEACLKVQAAAIEKVVIDAWLPHFPLVPYHVGLFYRGLVADAWRKKPEFLSLDIESFQELIRDLVQDAGRAAGEARQSKRGIFVQTSIARATMVGIMAAAEMALSGQECDQAAVLKMEKFRVRQAQVLMDVRGLTQPEEVTDLMTAYQADLGQIALEAS